MNASLNRRDALKAIAVTGISATGLSHVTAADKDNPKKPEKNGWWVKFDTQHSECKEIKFWIGLGGNGKLHKEWRTWKSNDPTEFDVPAEFRQVKEIWIKSKAIPEDNNAYVCIHYKSRTTQKLEFDNEEEYEISQGNGDKC